jgi:hypothetical protein
VGLLALRYVTMEFSLIHDKVEVYEDLRNFGCCQRCCLRYVGERNPQSYNCVKETIVKVCCISFVSVIVSKNTLNLCFMYLICFFSQTGLQNDKDFDSGPDRKIFKCNPCVVCLGLLQDEFSADDTVQKVNSWQILN